MRIKSVKAQNFKNFKNIDLDLHDFNVLIGQNASGKSNFIQLFRFIKDIKIHGLDNAISLQGGIDYLRNINLSHSVPLSIEVNLSNLRSYLNATARSRGREKDIRVLNVKYRFTLEFMKRQRNFSVAEDTAVIDLLILPATSRAEYVATLESGAEDDFVNWIQSNSAQGTVTLSKKGQKVDVISNIPEAAGIEVSKDDMPFRYLGKSGKRNLLLEQQYFLFPIANGDALSELAFYDIDPKLPKKAVPLSGRAELEFDGSNLAVVLKNLLRDRETRKRFTNLIVDLLPFAQKLRIESLADQSFLFKLQERYSKENYLPASLLSDGTIGVTALIVALYFERMVGMAIIEEPERNLHPALISRLMSMMRDVSKEKQLLITTHSPEVIRNCEIDDILFISRDEDGYSSIRRPAETEHVKRFLSEELGMDDLYVQNLLA